MNSADDKNYLTGKKPLSLAQYVKRRNGVPLGGKGALSKMLKRSLGAESFQQFWQYWNPIWGYYLAKWFFWPLSRFLPRTLAVVLTFIISGVLHDLAIILLTKQFSFFITLWFSIMGILLVILSALKVTYEKFSWASRALINLMFIVVSYVFATLTKSSLVVLI